jgi:photosynthetic reaction center cytochrome c subunit
VIKIFAGIVGIFFGALVIGVVFRDPTLSVQHGYRGTSMAILYKQKALEADAAINEIPEADPIDDPDPTLPPVSKKYKNVQVLNDLSVLEFSRLMGALATWIAPEEGCSYCHNQKNLASDEKYTKRVARRMILMTRRINNEWTAHVKETGVTCWTCHRGQAVPSGDWYRNPNQDHPPGLLGAKNNQNTAGITTNGNSSLPFDPLSTYLINDNLIRVQGTTALTPAVKHDSVQKAEHTYSLMIYMAKSLGVNCNYCHNTRAFANWPQSPPQRSQAWYGIRMVRELNTNVLIPIAPLLPDYRIGAAGDSPKVGCLTCHKGAYKPMYGVSMRADYPELWRKGSLINSGYDGDDKEPLIKNMIGVATHPVPYQLAPGQAVPSAVPNPAAPGSVAPYPSTQNQPAVNKPVAYQTAPPPDMQAARTN